VTPAVAYLRVSTVEQLDGGGLDVQREAVEVYCAAHGLAVVAWEVDEGVSGAIEDRVALVSALDRLKAGEASVLVIPKLDRLSRDLLVQEAVLRDIWRMGATVESCVESEAQLLQPDDPMDPTRKLMRQIMGAVAEWERAMIRARVVAGRRRKIREGGWAGGPVPYGFRCGVTGLEVDEREARVMRSMMALRRLGCTLGQLARDLNDEKIPARSGGKWTVGSVSRALASWEKFGPKEVMA
jgi:DNA invertase Pin-like site-specific DNA recombinase